MPFAGYIAVGFTNLCSQRVQNKKKQGNICLLFVFGKWQCASICHCFIAELWIFFRKSRFILDSGQ